MRITIETSDGQSHVVAPSTPLNTTSTLAATAVVPPDAAMSGGAAPDATAGVITSAVSDAASAGPAETALGGSLPSAASDGVLDGGSAPA
jgi:hypothetical protein